MKALLALRRNFLSLSCFGAEKAGLDTHLSPGVASTACRERTIVHQFEPLCCPNWPLLEYAPLSNHDNVSMFIQVFFFFVRWFRLQPVPVSPAHLSLSRVRPPFHCAQPPSPSDMPLPILIGLSAHPFANAFLDPLRSFSHHGQFTNQQKVRKIIHR